MGGDEEVPMNRNYVSYITVAVVLAVALAVAGVSFGAIVPFAILLVCPLMMVFMMKGMSGMRGEREHDSSQPTEPRS